jgi:ketosteroid isomerase-like protein
LPGHGFAEWSISMSIASDLLERHIQTLVADPAQWQTLIADDMVWELAYAPAIGHPSRLAGRDEITRHVNWFLGAVENFRFIEPRISAFANPLEAVVQVKAEAFIKPTRRVYRQEYVMFLLARDGKIAHIREYFDPTRAAKSMNEAILDLEPWF